MEKKQLVGATIATIAALAFASAPVTSSLAAEASKTVPCYGVNSCKGQSDCQTATSSCKGNNKCKGQGYLMKTSEDCQKMGGSTEKQ